MNLDDFDPDGPAGGDTLFGLPHGPARSLVHVIPVPFEATTSYRRGTRGAPAAVLEASLPVDLCDDDTGEAWRSGIAMLPEDPRIVALDRLVEADALAVIEAEGVDPHDAGLVASGEAVDTAGVELNAMVRAVTEVTLAEGRIPAVLGGDHSVPFGAIAAAADRFPGLGVLHVDAHADLREAYEGFTWSHASIFYNVLAHTPIASLVQVGIRDHGAAELELARTDRRVHCWLEADVRWELAGGASWRSICERMVADLPADVWVSFDIDGLEPALCPSTGTPVPGGLSWPEALVLLRVLGESGRRIVGFDLCEVGASEWDAIVGARMLYKLAGWAIKTGGGGR